MNDISKKIEALLFYEGGTMTKRALRAALGSVNEAGEVVECTEVEMVQGLLSLRDSLGSLGGRGVELYESASDVSLRAAPSMAEFLRAYDAKNMSENLGSAAIEVLAVLLYRGPSTQADVDSIRGVNSALTLRLLRMRGMITKDEIEDGEVGTKKVAQRRGVYSVTSEALAHLGVKSVSDIDGVEDVQKKLAAFEERAKMMEEKG